MAETSPVASAEHTEVAFSTFMSIGYDTTARMLGAEPQKRDVGSAPEVIKSALPLSRRSLVPTV
jgi:hypothetical protein